MLWIARAVLSAVGLYFLVQQNTAYCIRTTNYCGNNCKPWASVVCVEICGCVSCYVTKSL